MPLDVFIAWWGRRENAFVARREEDSVGTNKQFGIVICSPVLVWAVMCPWPSIGAFEMPSARVTDCDVVHGWNVLK